MGVPVLGWLAERRTRERSEWQFVFRNRRKAQRTGPIVQLFFWFFFFSIYWPGRLKGADCFFVLPTDCVKEQISEGEQPTKSACFSCSARGNHHLNRWWEPSADRVFCHEERAKVHTRYFCTKVAKLSPFLPLLFLIKWWVIKRRRWQGKND